jgi:hypothetical protein
VTAATIGSRGRRPLHWPHPVPESLGGEVVLVATDLQNLLVWGVHHDGQNEGSTAPCATKQKYSRAADTDVIACSPLKDRIEIDYIQVIMVPQHYCTVVGCVQVHGDGVDLVIGVGDSVATQTSEHTTT